MSYTELKQGKAVSIKDNLSIALIKQEDFKDIIAMFDDERVNKYLFFAPADESLYQAFFSPIIENTEQSLADNKWPDSPTFVIRNEQGEYMGMCALTQVMFHRGNYEVGYQLPFKAWGKGIATKVCEILTEIGFSELGAHKICADCYAGNVGSYKTLQKCGYRQEGRR